jgi:hypothetical protein
MHRSALARAALVAFAAGALGACSSAPPAQTQTAAPTFNKIGDASSAAATPESTAAIQLLPDSPMSTSALAVTRPQKGSSAPIGAVVFGTDYSTAAKNVTISGERTTFAAGSPIAWRVTLPAATGGESVRVTLSTADNTETRVDEFVAQAGWNVYYGKSLLTVAPGEYVLHYLVDGHEVGSGTFRIKASGTDSPMDGATDLPTDSPTELPGVATQAPTATQPPTATTPPTEEPTSTPTPEPTSQAQDSPAADACSGCES